jgi:hypothetical protein
MRGGRGRRGGSPLRLGAGAPIHLPLNALRAGGGIWGARLKGCDCGSPVRRALFGAGAKGPPAWGMGAGGPIRVNRDGARQAGPSA